MTEHDAKRQAAQHLIELETSGHSEEAWQRFEAWLREDPTHREVFAKVEKAWRTVGHLQEILQGRDISCDRTASQSLSQRLRQASRFWRARWRSISGGVIGLIAVAWFLYRTDSGEWTSQETGPNETRVVKLADDAIVTLNRSTKIETRSSWCSKQIRLERGEAVVDVTTRWCSSFLVYAGQTVLRDIGTRFDVVLVGDTHVEVVVERGSVVVTTPTASPSSSHPAQSIERTLQAGQSATVQSGRIVSQSVSARELARRIAWTKGLLVFDGTLDEAVAEFNRYNTRKLVVVDQKLLPTRVGGCYRATDPDSFAKYLHDTHGINSKWNGDVILVGVHP